METPNWIQAGVTVISLAVGAIGGYYSMANQVALQNQKIELLEEKVDELPKAVGELSGVVKDLNHTVSKMQITFAVVDVKLKNFEDKIETKERGR